MKILDEIVKKCMDQWHLSEPILLHERSMHVLFSVKKANQSVVLKVSSDLKGFAREARVLQAFHGQGCVRIIEQDIALGGLLLEQAVPGVSLKKYFPDRDFDAIKIASRIMQQLHDQENINTTHFPTIQDWLSKLDLGFDIPIQYLEKARLLSKALLASVAEPVLLHGDLHHENILLHGEEWIVIDPQGVIGEPAYEIGAFIRNPVSELCQHPDAADIINKRIQLFSEYLAIDPQRIRKWSYVQAVLAACWALEDDLDPSLWLQVANMIEVMDVCHASAGWHPVK